MSTVIKNKQKKASKAKVKDQVETGQVIEVKRKLRLGHAGSCRPQ